MDQILNPGRCGRLGKHASADWRCIVLCSIAILFVCGTASAQTPSTGPAIVPDQAIAAPSKRPRIGLVLGGGGAKGAAHVGVIRVLDQMHIPIDCIVGTSMGAVVGGIYATGVSAEELEANIRAIKWGDTIAFQGRREKLPMRRKLAGATYSNTLEFGWGEHGLTAPSGFINTQNIEQTIRRLTALGLGIQDFDSLPIQFRAVATDMQKGEMVVLRSGNLATALRASMAVPGFFAPVTIDGRVLGDGGLTRNVPVDIARQTCADVVIAVAVPNPVPKPEELQSPLTMLNRTIDVLVGANEREQLESLTERDVAIVIDPGEVTSGSFDKVNSAIPLGEQAARRHREELARYSVSEAEYLAWRDRTSRGSRSSVQLAEVKVDGLKRVDEQYVRSTLDLDAGSIIDQRVLSERIDDVYALDEFERVQYELTGNPDRPTLELSALEKPWGPNLLRFDVGLLVSNDGNAAFVLGGDYVRSGLNAFGGELHGVLAIGRTSTAEASLYQPIDRQRRFFVEPQVTFRRSIEDLYDGDDAVARFKFGEALGSLELGRVFGNRAELRVGAVSGVQAGEPDIAPRAAGTGESEGYGGWTVSATYDTRDLVALPTRGWLARVDYFGSDRALGAEAPRYSRLEGMLAHSVPLWNDVVEVTLMGGTSFGDELPIYDLFVLGGPNSLPGLNLGALRGNDYWSGSARYLHKVADISPIFGQALYFGTQLTAAEMRGRLDGRSAETIYSGELIVGGRTPLGPVTLSLAVTSTDQWQIVFGLGRPIEERTIADSDW